VKRRFGLTCGFQSALQPSRNLGAISPKRRWPRISLTC
jgi:hypothetical protein